MDLSNENVIHIKENGVEFLQFRRLLEYKDVLTHAITVGTENDYRMPLFNSPNNILTLEQIEENKNNYKKLCKCVGIDYANIVKTNQVHKDIIKKVEAKINNLEPDFHVEKYAEADGLFTNKSNLALCTTNADCIILMMYDAKKHIIANVHSGWKGTTQRIAVKAIDKMQEQYNCNPKDIICCISPSIRKCHFEVDEDVKEIFKNGFQNFSENAEKIQNKWHIDTVKINIEMLKEKGLKEENIIDSKICTVCNCTQIHSYRGSKHHNGLEMGIIELKK